MLIKTSFSHKKFFIEDFLDFKDQYNNLDAVEGLHDIAMVDLYKSYRGLKDGQKKSNHN